MRFLLLLIVLLGSGASHAQSGGCPKNVAIKQLEYSRKWHEGVYAASATAGIPGDMFEAAKQIQKIDRQIYLEYFNQGATMLRLARDGSCLSSLFSKVNGIQVAIESSGSDTFVVHSGGAIAIRQISTEALIELMRKNLGV